MATANATSADYIFANDPDADRFLVAQRCGASDGAWKIFNGNEMAALFAHFIAENHTHARSNPSSVAMLSSCVSSRFLKRICEKRGFRHETTATGFKNLGNRAWHLQEAGFAPLFAFEEAIGFAVGTWSLDKDGISALVTMMLMILREAPDLLGYLRAAQEAYEAVPVQCNGYLTVVRPREVITRMLSERIPRLKDEFPGVSVVEASVKASEFALPLAGWLMIRASGTEPKVKYYSETMKQEQESFTLLVESIVNFLLQ
jgi:phosphoglucomutase